MRAGRACAAWSGCLWGAAGCVLTPSARLASDFSPTEPRRVSHWKHACHAGDLFPSAHFSAEL